MHCSQTCCHNNRARQWNAAHWPFRTTVYALPPRGRSNSYLIERTNLVPEHAIFKTVPSRPLCGYQERLFTETLLPSRRIKSPSAVSPHMTSKHRAQTEEVSNSADRLQLPRCTPAILPPEHLTKSRLKAQPLVQEKASHDIQYTPSITYQPQDFAPGLSNCRQILAPDTVPTRKLTQDVRHKAKRRASCFVDGRIHSNR